jgi:oxygen-independent coproporphyrinogen-3 oxidase
MWTEALRREAAATPALGLRFDTLYLGGGTPSLLAGPAVAQVRNLVSGRFALEVGEFTLEANPDAGSIGLLPGWREAGVSRLSVGVQSFDDGVLSTLGRTYSADEAVRFCRSARAAGFDILAVDLMIGVPGETDGAVGRSLDRAIELGPDHVSVYFLENVEGLPFANILARRPVDEDAAVDHFETAKARLEASGLRRYEISNFAKPGRECRHNLKYWRYEPYMGLGPSACSHVGLRRWCREAGLEKWAEAAGPDGGAAEKDVLELTPEAAASEALVFGLRLVEGVDLADIGARIGVDVAARYAGKIDELAAEGLLVRAGSRVRIPSDKLLVSNAILSRLI